MRKVLHKAKESRFIRKPNWLVRSLLLTGTWLWQRGGSWRNRLFETGVLKKYRLPVPVISVGNVVAGGTGKTPMVEYLTQIMISRRILLLSRGYGDDEHVSGLSLHSGVSCAFGANRGRLGYEHFAKTPFRFEIVLLDDGLQHPTVHKDIEIIMINAIQGMENEYDNVIPLGLLRERWEDALPKADVVVLHHADKVSPNKLLSIASRARALTKPQCTLLYSRMAPLGLVSFTTMPLSGLNLSKMVNRVVGNEIEDHSAEIPYCSQLEFEHVHVFCGIGCGEAFLQSVQGFLGPGYTYTVQTFSDHHNYSIGDLNAILEATRSNCCAFVTTEKDFYRAPWLMLSAFQKRKAYCFRAKLELIPSKLSY